MQNRAETEVLRYYAEGVQLAQSHGLSGALDLTPCMLYMGKGTPAEHMKRGYTRSSICKTGAERGGKADYQGGHGAA